MTIQSSKSPASIVSDHLAAIDQAITPLDAPHANLVAELTALAGVMGRIRTAGGRVYVCGNGGSCANAAHLVLHLREVGIKAFNLLGDTPWMSAVANDRAYDQVFSWTLHTLGAGPGDLLIVISGSGKSANIIAAVRYAQKHNIPRWGLLGRAAGVLGPSIAELMCDGVVMVDSEDYGTIEDIHSIAIHALTKTLR